MKSNELFEQVTANLIDAIEAGASDWRMPWRSLAQGMPTNIEGRVYRGVNALVLAMVGHRSGWSSERWATYRAWQRHGAQVRQRERGTQVVLWKLIERDGDVVESGVRDRRLVARTFTVFAIEQVDGAEHLLRERTTDCRLDHIDAADCYFSELGAQVVIGGDRACYVPGLDEIHLPGIEQFDDAAGYYSTAAHEHVHWTGHVSRLGRALTGRFGDRAYGAEELVAELGAAFWCGQFGLEQATRQDHAAYIADWLALLRSDHRAIVSACSHAQRAVDYLNGLADQPRSASTQTNG